MLPAEFLKDVDKFEYQLVDEHADNVSDVVFSWTFSRGCN